MESISEEGGLSTPPLAKFDFSFAFLESAFSDCTLRLRVVVERPEVEAEAQDVSDADQTNHSKNSSKVASRRNSQGIPRFDLESHSEQILNEAVDGNDLELDSDPEPETERSKHMVVGCLVKRDDSPAAPNLHEEQKKPGASSWKTRDVPVSSVILAAKSKFFREVFQKRPPPILTMEVPAEGGPAQCCAERACCPLDYVQFDVLPFATSAVAIPLSQSETLCSGNYLMVQFGSRLAIYIHSALS